MTKLQRPFLGSLDFPVNDRTITEELKRLLRPKLVCGKLWDRWRAPTYYKLNQGVAGGLPHSRLQRMVSINGCLIFSS